MNLLFRRLLLLSLPSLLLPTLAAAEPKCDRCKDLPRLEKELFEQEWLQREFYEYAMGNKTPPTSNPGESADALAGQVLADFKKWLGTPAGGGKGGKNAAPDLGTDFNDCSLVKYRKFTPAEAKAEAKAAAAEKRKPDAYKTEPFDEDEYRKKHCKELADFALAHENKHVENCKKNQATMSKDISYWRDYAADDVEAYGTGIRNLRASIAKLAKECGWQGSSDAEGNPKDKKKDLQDQEEDIVPTMKQAKELAKSLKKGAAK